MASVELRQRIISGAILIALALGALLQGVTASALFIAGLFGLGMSEWVRMLAPKQPRLFECLGVGIVLVLLVVGYGARPAVALLLGVVLMLLHFVLAARLDLERAGWLTLGIPYLGGSALAMLYVRQLPDGGFGMMLYLITVVWGTDIGAYFAGRRFGGPKLLPAVSPSKTWSGLAGGMITAALLALFVAWVEPMRKPLVGMALAVVLALVAQLGDLFESYVKRRCGVKDSGNLIPGHGGVLDRIDGLVFAVLFLVLFQAMIGNNLAWW